MSNQDMLNAMEDVLSEARSIRSVHVVGKADGGPSNPSGHAQEGRIIGGHVNDASRFSLHALDEADGARVIGGAPIENRQDKGANDAPRGVIHRFIVNLARFVHCRPLVSRCRTCGAYTTKRKPSGGAE